MRITRGSPHPTLAGVVSGYADFAQRTSGPTETGEVPGRSIVVIVDLDAGWTVEGERFGSFAGGLYARPVRVRHEGSASGVQFDLEPPAARALLGVPAGELGERTVSLEDLLGSEAALLAERLHGAADAGARFEALDDALRRRLDRARLDARPDVARAWALLRASGGRMRVDALAEALGCSRRHLAKRFAEEVGASPKFAARLIRFEAARARLGSVPLARLAAEHGYSDQAHLAREFSALGGAPPTEFPSVQDDAAAAA
ncbi:MAG TPA: helix-turn-helix domain-containing protein [Thermoleophilaceae bacterium]|nr:helix-turn-helix domain-containing protein [Thermoleophilaceae bacterium]